MRQYFVLIPVILSSLSVACLIFSACDKDGEDRDPKFPNTAPHAAFAISPDRGTTETNFFFDASEAHDYEKALHALEVRWDWENDGEWDTEWDTSKSAYHSYEFEGAKTILLEVKDYEGLKDTATNHVVVINEGGGTGEPCPSLPTFSYQGQVYNTVLIGSQCWMKENLNYETGNSWCYDDDPANCLHYGRLYDWETIMNGEPQSDLVPSRVQGICPPGFHIPSDGEWKVLEGRVDSEYGIGHSIWNELHSRGSDAGTKLKSMNGWAGGGNGTGEYKFNAKPGGYLGGIYQSLTGSGRWWSATEYDGGKVWYRNLYYGLESIGRYSGLKEYGYSLRCIKD